MHATEGVFYLTTALLVPDGDLSNVDFELGVSMDGMQIPISPSTYLPLSSTFLDGAAELDSEVIAFTFPIPEFVIHFLGEVSFYATSSPSGIPVTSATVANLVSTSGVLATQQISQVDSGPGVTIRPISPTGDLPTSFTSTQICFQNTALLGVENNIQLFRVIDAGCVPSSSSCIPGCALTAGGTVKLLDPLALIGG